MVGAGILGSVAAAGAVGSYLYRKNKSKVSAERASELFNTSAVELSSGKLEEAISHLTEAINLKPEPKYYVNRANALVRLKRFEEAHEDATKACKSDPSSKALFYKAKAAEGLKSYKEAVRDFKKVLNRDDTEAVRLHRFAQRGLQESEHLYKEEKAKKKEKFG